MSADTPRTTHAAESTWRGKDGVKRVTSIARSSADTYLLTMETYWNGDDNEPMRTPFHFGFEAYQALASLIIEFALDLGRFARKEDQPESAP